MMEQPEKKVQLVCTVREGIRDIVNKKCRALGIDSSEYQRQLILNDLKSSGFLEDRLHPEKRINNHAINPASTPE
jgi:hypothetical protein